MNSFCELSFVCWQMLVCLCTKRILHKSIVFINRTNNDNIWSRLANQQFKECNYWICLYLLTIISKDAEFKWFQRVLHWKKILLSFLCSQKGSAVFIPWMKRAMKSIFIRKYSRNFDGKNLKMCVATEQFRCTKRFIACIYGTEAKPFEEVGLTISLCYDFMNMNAFIDDLFGFLTGD